MSVKVCLQIQGTQSWTLNRDHVKRCEYAVLCRNANSDWGDGSEPHETAFLIGRIADVVPSIETRRRWRITFDQFARINVPKAWKDWRKPVRYTSLDEIGLSLRDVMFQPMPTPKTSASCVVPE
jgi:hypothetical protein